ncbi:MAG: glutamate synthase large subunit [Clostridium sp.]
MRSNTTEHDACGIGAIVNIDGRKDHSLIDQALTIVERLDHRAGKDASGKVGDGVGILLQISHRFFSKAAFQEGFTLPKPNDYGIAMLFLPQEASKRFEEEKQLESIIMDEGAEVLGWRDVPCQSTILGDSAYQCMPKIRQCFIQRPAYLKEGLSFEQLLYVIRRQFETRCKDTYVVSMSSKTIVYKGMFLVNQLRLFYDDLQDEQYESALAIIHSRFSTNTQPSWERAQPYHMIAHNGEINTIQGNQSHMSAREETMYSSFLETQKEKILPVVKNDGSDSAILDNTLEFLYMNNIPMEKAIMMMIPEPWRNTSMVQEKKDFYHYYATMMEPWDGPAAILFTDGEKLGAVLDRNGLRPLRWWLSDDHQLVLSSEVGVLPIYEEHIVCKERLRPGQMLLADTVKKHLFTDEECKTMYMNIHPYEDWLNRNLLQLKDLPVCEKKMEVLSKSECKRLYKAFGYTLEDIHEQILPMAKNGVESTASMGADIPLAVLSKCHPILFHYFKQRFAQVTNPPIDSLRETIITDTSMYLGKQGNLLQDEDVNCRVLEIHNPILDEQDMDKIRTLHKEGFHVEEVSILFHASMHLEEAIEHLLETCDHASEKGTNILILTDCGIDENHLAIPSLLAISAIEQHFTETKKNTISIVLESGEPRNVHHFATLLGYGASAVYPYLAHESIREMVEENIIDKEVSVAIRDYNDAILHGVLKAASKMGVSTLQSYRSARLFEAIGLHRDVVNRYFSKTISQAGGITLKEIEEDVRYHHQAFCNLENDKLETIGFHRFQKGKAKEHHLYNPEAISTLQKAVRDGDYAEYKCYSQLIHQENDPISIRSLLTFDTTKRKSIPLSSVESAQSIVKRFKTGAMSYGSISEEAHTCLAEAMNQLHGKSNSGEGGEKPERYHTKYNSAIKQVASGRFGVTSEYLNSADEIQIKMAQGAKPGEGGHLPGNKVYPWIAKTRHSTPGVTLISPPPHHDIYSIEDLAQLIYDLKNANPKASISVKLAAEEGVGTIACGTAKAGAQNILISGCDGGTGAAPQSSIHHAGLPWELGLSQAHEQLVKNHLRSRVRLETDGKLMSGRDVAIAALLGAEEFGFATAPLVAIGCKMLRVCSLDTCPYGIATQNEALRQRFQGKPQDVINFMLFVAEHLREIMAELGFKTVEEMIGHKECLKINKQVIGYERLQLEELLTSEAKDGKVHFDKQDEYDFHLEQTKDTQILIPGFKNAIKNKQRYYEKVNITNTDRTFGTLLGSYITTHYGNELADDFCHIDCIGSGGQSFGAFLPKGIYLALTGDANDYFGKGLSGAILSVTPSSQANYKPEKNIIIGNVALYGATSGYAFINGVAGERFAVRNSGAVAVVEGCGNHALEYMTGGCVVILGETGKNIAAGMSGGIAYILDEKHDLHERINSEMVEVNKLEESDYHYVKQLIEAYVKATNSSHGKHILEHFEIYHKDFMKIIPHDYRIMKEYILQNRKQGLNEEQAELKAFEQMKIKRG